MWKTCQAFRVNTTSLSSGFHPQANGQMEQTNQELEADLLCVLAKNPTTWGSHLVWIEYAHNSLSCSALNLSPFETSLKYQPPLFPTHEEDIAVPLVQVHLHHCHKIWREAWAALLCSDAWQITTGPQTIATSQGKKCGSQPRIFHSRPRHLLPPQFIGPFEAESIISPASICFKLPKSLCIHLTFHVSQLKPVITLW